MERGEFEEIDHTADLGLDLEGPTPEAILEAAQRGLIRLLLGDTSDLAPDRVRDIAISAPALPQLLKRWCERIYGLLESEGFVALTADVGSADPRACEATLHGIVPPPDRVASAGELKGVTYHQLAFGPAGDGWRARVIFDV
ncbi:MAG TPA: archease [Gemmatimonadota bacterium]|nr:archease [Gemmatimonadota bacterium]